MSAAFFQFRCNVERCLAAELYNNTQWLFFIIDRHDIFHGKRLEVQLVGGVVVCGYGFRVAVYHDGLKSQISQSKGSVNTAVVKFNTLSDPVRTAAQDHDFSSAGYRGFILPVVGGVIVCGRFFYTAYRNCIPALVHAQGFSSLEQLPFVNIQKLCQIFV